jgi:hypothetical protein
MKKQINILLLLLLTVFLSSCFTSVDDVNKAKQNLWIIDWWTNLDLEIQKAKDQIDNADNNKEIKQDSIEEIEEIVKKDEVKKIEINSLTSNQLLEFDDLSRKNLLSWEVEITWKTLWKVDKIVVSFSNETSDFPVDVYTLKQFVAWSETFLYRAFSKYETLDYWKNVYLFEAYSGDEITKLELVLNVVKDEEKNIQSTNDVYEKIDLTDLPSNEKFWNPIDLGNWKISYSDLNWLEIRMEVKPELTCEKVTSVLADYISWYFYWNTCRPVNNDEWVSFYVIRLDWDNYFYEKHYYLPYQWLYWVQELETWTWVTNLNIWEKNAELKENNSEFGILKITDDLFKEILK